MQLARVIGTATATVKHPTLQGERMLVVQLETQGGRPDGEPILAFDRLGARRGDLVIVTNDGRALQDLLGKDTPARWSVLALPDRGQRAGRES
jgi:ethanolamine utilization protein EutN